MVTLKQLLTEREAHVLINKFDLDIEVKDLTVQQLFKIGLYLPSDATNKMPVVFDRSRIIAAEALTTLTNRALSKNLPIF